MSVRRSICAELEPDILAAGIGEAEMDTAERLAGHLNECGVCREQLERYRTIEEEVTALRRGPESGPHVEQARERLESRLADLRSRLVAYRVFPSRVGRVLIARSEQGVLLVEYLDRSPRIDASRLSRVAGIEALEGGADVEGLWQELREYLDGRRTRLAWPLDLRLVRSAFHREVLQATQEIPYGAVISYAGLAREVGRPAAIRAAAQALRWNPLPIVIPCHRVVGTSGALTGYAGGETTRKRWLLNVEGVPISKLRRDFAVARDTMYARAPGDTEYCLPTCPSVNPFPLGGLLFGSQERAEAAGLAPCRICRPDLHPLSP